MRIFISYARVDKPYCMKIADMLDIHDVWYDYRIYAGNNWWREIVSHLEWCDAFVYLLSPDSLNSKYCRLEFEIAQRLGKKILPVLIDDDARHKMPKAIQELQYADLTKGFTSQALKLLFNSIYLLERQTDHHHRHVSSVRVSIDDLLQPDQDSPTTIIGKAADAMEVGKYDEALFLLRNAKERGHYEHVDLDALISEAEIGLDKRIYQKKIELEYKTIAELIRRKRTRRLGCQALYSFRRDNPDYDPDNLSSICAGNVSASMPDNVRMLKDRYPRTKPKQTNGTNTATQTAPKSSTTLPLLSWVPITAGETFGVRTDAFHISKYPITNEQYGRFLRDPRGYHNETWWKFSPYAQDWFRKSPKPRPPLFPFATNPRENVAWYEAVAFTYWLSARLGKRIALPTQAQWRRAASGDDNRTYPWGMGFDSTRANTRKTPERHTTPVTKYESGKSFFDVYDMAGNVWEWCLNTSDEPPDCVSDLTAFQDRALLGGSWNTGAVHVKVQKEFYLDPRNYYSTIGFRVVMLDEM